MDFTGNITLSTSPKGSQADVKAWRRQEVTKAKQAGEMGRPTGLTRSFGLQPLRALPSWEVSTQGQSKGWSASVAHP